MTIVAVCGIALVAAGAALLVAEWRRSERGIWLTKPLASTLFIVIALVAGARDSTFGQWVLLGLVLFGVYVQVSPARRKMANLYLFGSIEGLGVRAY